MGKEVVLMAGHSLFNTTHLRSILGQVTTETQSMEVALQELYELIADRKNFLAALPTRRPAAGRFTSGFGVRLNPYRGRIKMHEGLDIANHPGTKIFATANGIVLFSGYKPGYGKTVIIDHGYGMETWYGHNSAVLVKRGDLVMRGQPVAQMGSSGHSTGPHLHYEVRVNGIPTDPLPYIFDY